MLLGNTIKVYNEYEEFFTISKEHSTDAGFDLKTPRAFYSSCWFKRGNRYWSTY